MSCGSCRACLSPNPIETTPMTKQTHNVATDALATLGTIIDENAGRDAIHLAVEPSIAAAMLLPGESVGFVEGGMGRCDKPVGIVDPFLINAVLPGQRFWLLIYPRQITSLRHVWEHPAFPEAVQPGEPKDDAKKDASKRWMRAWAMKHMGEDYYGDDGEMRSEDVAYASAIEAGHEKHIGPYESAREYIDGEWWDHWETITGERGDRDSYFSCGC